MFKVKNLKRLNKSEKHLVEMCVGTARNSKLEDLHCGTFPSTKTGDYSDVKVISPFGEIPWDKLSRISDKEMGPLKDSFRDEFIFLFRLLKSNGLKVTVDKKSIINKILK
jgi:hypothetical protein